jgi:hypothetical protein
MRSAKEKSPASVMLTGLQCEPWFAFEFTPPRAPSVQQSEQTLSTHGGIISAI